MNNQVSLVEALAAATKLNPAEVLAILYSPGAFHFCRAQAEVMVAFDGVEDTAIAAETIYEARLFGTQAEVRWRRTGLSGRMSIRAAGDDEIDLTCLLWGRAEEVRRTASGAWTRMASPRTPEIWLPFEGRPGSGVLLTGQETVEVGPDGNSHVAGERLTGLALSD